MTPHLKEVLRGFLPRRIRPWRIRRGPLAGRAICTSWHDYPGAIRGNTETALLAWFARNVRPGETWLDIGAHYGYTAIALSELVGKIGRVLAFEPVLATAQCIARTREINGIPQLEVLPFGLAAEGGIRTDALPLYRGMADSTLAGRVPEQPILVASFDQPWPSLSDGNPVVHGVKIDVQGMEADVLAGMSGMLRRCHPRMVVEFHEGVDTKSILDLLVSCGYSRGFQPIESGGGDIQPDRSYAFEPAEAGQRISAVRSSSRTMRSS